VSQLCLLENAGVPFRRGRRSKGLLFKKQGSEHCLSEGNLHCTCDRAPNITFAENKFMRIIGRIPHPTLQITVFSNDGRFPVQFERSGLSQTYRFRRSDQLRGLADVKKLVNEDLIKTVLGQFSVMQRAHSLALNTFAPPEAPSDLDGLPDII